jgi:PAS domain S-box-containing protein
METAKSKQHIIEPLQQADGRRLWIDTTKIPLFDAEGKVCGVIGVYEDITERKQAIEALQESEAKYRALFEFSNDAIFLMDQDLAIECNNKVMDLFKIGLPEEIKGKTPYDFSPPYQPDGQSSQEKGREKIQAALAGQPQFFEWRHVLRDGTILDVEVSLHAVALQGKMLVQSITHDVTDRKRVEETLRASQRQLKDIFNFLPDATFAVDLNDKVIAWNKAAEELTGVRAEDILGKDSSECAMAIYHEKQPMIIDIVLHPEMGAEKLYPISKREKDVILAENYVPASGMYLWGKASVLYD